MYNYPCIINQIANPNLPNFPNFPADFPFSFLLDLHPSHFRKNGEGGFGRPTLITIWLFNIAMDRFTIFKNGKPSISIRAISHGERTRG